MTENRGVFLRMSVLENDALGRRSKMPTNSRVSFLKELENDASMSILGVTSVKFLCLNPENVGSQN